MEWRSSPKERKMNLKYCYECDDFCDVSWKLEQCHDKFKNVDIVYNFNVCRCKECNNEVPATTDYYYKKNEAMEIAYKKKMNIVTVQEMHEILDKYCIKREALANIVGFGTATIKRYFDEGYTPTTKYSETLLKILQNEKFFYDCVQENQAKLSDKVYAKIQNRHEQLLEIDKSKISQVANYIIIMMEEVSPLALEKLIYFSEGVNYAINKSNLVDEMSQAWTHGPVYPSIFQKYKKYGYKPIDNGIKSTSGCMLSLLKKEELASIDLVIDTFGKYSPKVLEEISHLQDPWIEKRKGISSKESSNEEISRESIHDFYIRNNLNSKENILNYIKECLEIIKERKYMYIY